MVGVAIAMFIALFGWGANYFGWSDPEHKVQLALAASFILHPQRLQGQELGSALNSR